MNTGYVFNKRFIDHVLSFGHPEAPERLMAIEKRMKETGLIEKVVEIVDYIEDPIPFIKRNHSDAHIASVQRIPETGEIAELAVGAVLGAVKAVSEGKVNNAFCAIRPPGHHAHNSGGEEGFCFYNNMAIAAKYAQSECNHKKILIIDWDYHHGNGTQDAFYYDPSVLFFSTHNWFTYPGTGDPSMTGVGDGEGFTINVHMDSGATDDTIIGAWKKYFLPKAETFKPDFILISAGFDSREQDLLGTFNLTDKCYSELTKMALEIAHNHCDGRLVSMLEGGYYPEGIAKAVVAHVKALMKE